MAKRLWVIRIHSHSKSATTSGRWWLAWSPGTTTGWWWRPSSRSSSSTSSPSSTTTPGTLSTLLHVGNIGLHFGTWAGFVSSAGALYVTYVILSDFVKQFTLDHYNTTTNFSHIQDTHTLVFCEWRIQFEIYSIHADQKVNYVVLVDQMLWICWTNLKDCSKNVQQCTRCTSWPTQLFSSRVHKLSTAWHANLLYFRTSTKFPVTIRFMFRRNTKNFPKIQKHVSIGITPCVTGELTNFLLLGVQIYFTDLFLDKKFAW